LLIRSDAKAAGLIVLVGGLVGLIGFNAHRILPRDETGYSHFANLADVFASYFSFVTVAIGILVLSASKARRRRV
jgi:midasin (ATPase involved in ribosome maturation)